jgi:hypothetical protein
MHGLRDRDCEKTAICSPDDVEMFSRSRSGRRRAKSAARQDEVGIPGEAVAATPRLRNTRMRASMPGRDVISCLRIAVSAI